MITVFSKLHCLFISTAWCLCKLCDVCYKANLSVRLNACESNNWRTYPRTYPLGQYPPVIGKARQNPQDITLCRL